MLPNFLGIGPTKTATTWLFACLREHPQVFLPDAKETQFFVRKDYVDDLTEYEAFFESAGDAKAVGEISPRYFASAEATERVHRYLPGARLIITLRHPIERLESEYWHLKRLSVDFAGESHRIPDTIEQALQTHPHALIESSMYASNLKRWLAHFDRKQVHIVFSDDIKRDPAGVMREVFRFLDVDPNFVPQSLTQQGANVRQGVSPRSGFLGKAYTHVYSFLVRFIYRPVRRVIGLKSASAIKDTLRARQIMSAIFHKRGYPKMAAATRAELCKRFEADVRELEAMTGRDLSAWRV